MPWREQSVMEQREEFVKLALVPGANKSELCRRFGISRDKGYKWIRRYVAEGRAGLTDRSRRPHRSPRRSAPSVEAEVLRLRKASNNAWGGRKIAKVMSRGHQDVPSPSTITEILRRNGKLEERAGEHPGRYQRFERAHPNELWQMDFKGHFAIATGRCHPLTVIDDHSRYAIGLQACGDERDSTVRGRLVGIFRHYGLPCAMLMDNGAPWGDSGSNPFTAFTVWLIRLGVRVTHCRPLHPQTQGKDERFHRSLKAEVLDRRCFRDLDDCQRRFDAWRRVYNHERPHDALALATPSERYRPSERGFPEQLPAVGYRPGDIVRKVDVSGHITLKSRVLHIGRGFRGELIALRPSTEDGLFSVHFCTQDIGIIDLRKVEQTACGIVDIARAMPTIPQVQQQQTTMTDL